MSLTSNCEKSDDADVTPSVDVVFWDWDRGQAVSCKHNRPPPNADLMLKINDHWWARYYPKLTNSQYREMLHEHASVIPIAKDIMAKWGM